MTKKKQIHETTSKLNEKQDREQNDKLPVPKGKRSLEYLHGGIHQFIIERYKLWLPLSSTRTANQPLYFTSANQPLYFLFKHTTIYSHKWSLGRIQHIMTEYYRKHDKKF